MSATAHSQLGDPRTTDLERRAAVVTGRVALICVGSCTVFFFVGAALSHVQLLAFFGTYLLVYGVVWLLHRRGLYRASAWLLFGAVDSGIAVLNCLLGPDSLVQIMFLLVPVMGLLLAPRESRRVRAAMLLVGPLTLVLLELRGYDLVPRLELDPLLVEVVRWPLIIAAFATNLVMLWSYGRDHEARIEVEHHLAEERALTQRLEQAHASAREAEDRLRLVVETMPSGLVVMRDGRVTYANRLALALFDPWTTITSPEALDLVGAVLEPDRARLARELAEARSVPLELRVRRTDGSEVPVEAMVSRVPGQAERYVTLRDLTEERRVAAEKVALAENLRQTQKLESLGVLAGGIAHDFGNLLTGILGNASAGAALVAARSEAAACIAEIEAAARSAGDLCRQLLAYSGRGTLITEAVDLSALVGDTTRLLGLSIRKHARLELGLARDLPSVVVDPTQIRQVAMNLVMNAADALGERGGVVRVTTALESCDASRLARCHLGADLPAGDYVVLEVEDDGSGMAPETLRRIFEPFFTTKATGRGLGLAAVLGIARGHHGALEVTSTLGAGTRFRLLLPAARGATAPPLRAATGPATEQRWHGRVLLVDDDARVRKVTRRTLTRLGFDVLEAVDGVEGVEAVRGADGAFRLVVLDSEMPRMNGREALTEVRRLEPRLPVLVVSGFDGSDVVGGFGADPRTRFLQKPFTASALEEAIAGVIGSGDA